MESFPALGTSLESRLYDVSCGRSARVRITGPGARSYVLLGSLIVHRRALSPSLSLLAISLIAARVRASGSHRLYHAGMDTEALTWQQLERGGDCHPTPIKARQRRQAFPRTIFRRPLLVYIRNCITLSKMAPGIIADSSFSTSLEEDTSFAHKESPVDISRWPFHLQSSLAWDGSDQDGLRDMSYLLTVSDLAEIKDALAYFKGTSACRMEDLALLIS